MLRALVFAMLVVGIAHAGAPLSASSVAGSVSSIGAQQTLAQFYANKREWHALLSAIATGKPEWLRIANRLRSGSDAGSTEQLTLAVGEALERRAADVLTISPPAYSIAEICGGPDVDDPRFNSYDLAMAAIARREVQVKSVAESSLRSQRDACLAELHNAREGVANFYGPKN